MKIGIKKYSVISEFSPHEWFTVIVLFMQTLYELWLDSKKSQRYQVEWKFYKITRDKKKK